MSAGENLMRFAERDGVRIHFEVVSEGPPVVLLHGGGPHHVASRRPTDEGAYSLEEYAADVKAVIKALRAPRSGDIRTAPMWRPRSPNGFRIWWPP
jgi:pimeloyl-ACP methyl ester carboxylesterase